MNNNNFERQETKKGLLVTDEFPLGIPPSVFIDLVDSSKDYPSLIFAKWVMQRERSDGVNFQFAGHKYFDGKQICLYCFPPTMNRSFGLEDIVLPLETVGFVIIVDVENLLQLGHMVPEEYSALHWVKKYHLPVIIAVTHSAKIKRDVEKLAQLINFSSEMPIVWCDEDIDFNCVVQTMEVAYSYI